MPEERKTAKNKIDGVFPERFKDAKIKVIEHKLSQNQSKEDE